jgi:hypothetical protein
MIPILMKRGSRKYLNIPLPFTNNLLKEILDQPGQTESIQLLPFF